MFKKILLISLVLAGNVSLADDTEIFKGRRTTDKPNVMFLMDTSSSMSFYATLNPSDVLPLQYDPKVRYPRVLNGYDHDAVYITNGVWMRSYDALKILNNQVSDSIDQRNMKRYKIDRSAVQCPEVEAALKTYGFWSYRKRSGGNNPKVKLYSQKAKNKKVLGRSIGAWSSLPFTTSTAPASWDLDYLDPSSEQKLMCRGQAGVPSSGWGNRYAEKVATGNYLNYISAVRNGKFFYSRMSILQDSIYHALGKLKGINIGLSRPEGKAGYIVDTNARGGGVTIPLMQIENAQPVFDKEISRYLPKKYNALTETLYETWLYLTGKPVKFGSNMEYRVAPRTQVVYRDKAQTLLGLYGKISNDHAAGRLDDSGYSVLSSIASGSKYIQPTVKECTTSDVILFSDGKDYFQGNTIFNSTGDVEANQAIVDLIKNTSFPTNSYLYNRCRQGGGSNLASAPYNQACIEELAYYMANEDQYPGIGAQGSVNEKQTIRVHTIGGFLNQDPADIGRLRRISQAGKGLFYKADNLVDMRNVIYSAIANTLNVTSTFTAPNVPVSATNRLQDSDDIYLPLFKPQTLTNWAGNFKRYKLNGFNQIVDANNQPAINNFGFVKDTAQSIWSNSVDGNSVTKGGMASHLSVNRKVWVNYGNTLSKFENSGVTDATRQSLMSFKPGSAQALLYDKVKDWVRGVVVSPDNKISPRTSMEDFIHSAPLMVNYANTSNSNKPYQTIFVGSNSGFLHAFDPDKTNPGERYTFVPQSLFKNFKYYFFNEYAWVDKPYGLDGPITSWHHDPNRNGIIDNGEKAYLYVGMRRGGHSYYALDISNKDQPQLKWVIHGNYPANTVNKPTTTSGYSRLGQTWSPMIPAEVKWKVGQNIKTKTVLFVGGGYNPSEDGTTDTGPKKRLSYNNMGNTIYMIDAETGNVLWDAKKHVSNNAMTNSFVSKPVPIDVNGNGSVDMLYATDVGGRVWRFDFNSNSTLTGASNFATGGVIADLNGGVSGNEEDNRRFFSEPDISYFKGKTKPILISVGSGYRAHPLSEEVKDYHFLIKDVLNKPSTYTALTFNDFKPLETQIVTSIVKNTTTASNTNAIDSNSPNGWRIPLVGGKGEKVLAATTTVKGQVFISTYSPKVTANAQNVANCIPKYGVTRLYNVNIHTVGKKKVLVKELAQSGIPSQPAVLFNRQANSNNGGGGNGGGGGGNGGGGNGGNNAPSSCEQVGAVTMIGTEVIQNSLNRCGQVKSIYWREVDQ